jgi:hypothetical protein
MEKYQEGLVEFSGHARFEVGDGSKIKFITASGVGTRHLRNLSHFCIVLLLYKML